MVKREEGGFGERHAGDFKTNGNILLKLGGRYTYTDTCYLTIHILKILYYKF